VAYFKLRHHKQHPIAKLVISGVLAKSKNILNIHITPLNYLMAGLDLVVSYVLIFGDVNPRNM
jgi:hypothetical protein